MTVVRVQGADALRRHQLWHEPVTDGQTKRTKNRVPGFEHSVRALRMQLDQTEVALHECARRLDGARLEGGVGDRKYETARRHLDEELGHVRHGQAALRHKGPVRRVM